MIAVNINKNYRAGMSEQELLEVGAGDWPNISDESLDSHGAAGEGIIFVARNQMVGAARITGATRNGIGKVVFTLKSVREFSATVTGLDFPDPWTRGQRHPVKYVEPKTIAAVVAAAGARPDSTTAHRHPRRVPPDRHRGRDRHARGANRPGRDDLRPEVTMTNALLKPPQTTGPRTWAGAERVLESSHLGVEDWGARFADQSNRTIERAITDRVNDLTDHSRTTLLRTLVFFAVLASRLQDASDLLQRYGVLHSLPAATYCADITWADEHGNIRVETEGKSRDAAGNWVRFARILDLLSAGTLLWRTDPVAAAFRAGAPRYNELWEFISQAEYPCLALPAWLEAGYTVAQETYLALWTASPRKDGAATWRGADHAHRWRTSRWLDTFAYLFAKVSDPAVRGNLPPDELAGLEELTRMIGSA